MYLEVTRGLAVLSLSFVLAWATAGLVGISVPSRPSVGYSGLQRDRTFAQNSPLERVIRLGGGWMIVLAEIVRARGPRAATWVKSLEEAQHKRLIWAGTPGGLTVHEGFFCSLLGLVLGTGAGMYLAYSSQSWSWLFPSAALGGSLLQIRLRALAAERFLQIKHQLPSVVDLVALAMQAGADLPSALTKIAERQVGVVGDELRQLLFALDMGLTRRTALLAFEERCPVDEVSDLVRTVVMAEQKGASVADSLVQLATTSRQRRSVRAEESAARAGVLLMIPIMLLMGCVVILLVGPLVCVSNKI